MNQAPRAWKYLACLLGLATRVACGAALVGIAGALLAIVGLNILLAVLQHSLGLGARHAPALHFILALCIALCTAAGAALAAKSWWDDLRCHPDADVRALALRVERWRRLLRR